MKYCTNQKNEEDFLKVSDHVENKVTKSQFFLFLLLCLVLCIKSNTGVGGGQSSSNFR